MPGMDGDQLAEAVKAAAPETPIILISGLGGHSVDCTRFAAFLRKPFTMTELVSTVEDLLSTEPSGRTKVA
jgi:FixJ family two-component response regulator